MEYFFMSQLRSVINLNYYHFKRVFCPVIEEVIFSDYWISFLLKNNLYII